MPGFSFKKQTIRLT